jgi:gliding motility-associated-like protein
MNRYVTVLFSLVLFMSGVHAQHVPGTKHDNITAQGSNDSYSIKWAVNPFDNKIFIQNLGQFDSSLTSVTNVLYGTSSRNVNMYFTSTGFVYKYSETKQEVYFAGHHPDADDPDKAGFVAPVIKYMKAEWVGANPSVAIVADSGLTYYYAYSMGNPIVNVRAKIYKKITYKNLYPGIDVEYFFPEKGGVKYNVLVHPGADISVMKLKYSGANNLHMDKNGNILINTSVGNFIDHAPVSYYTGNNKKASIRYNLNGFEEGFTADASLDNSAELYIDPWQTDPFPGTAPNDKVYDVDYDNNGNVYGYGSASPFEEVKLNNAGTIQWVYSASALVANNYGDFAVDKVSGTSYLTEGYDAGGAKALKVNSLGALTATWAGTTTLDELWRDEYDECNHVIVCGAGGTSGANQACTLDTTLTTMNPQNVMGVATAYHDVCMLAIDPSGGSCYMCSTSDALDTGNANNFLFKLPVPSLTPTTFSARDGFHFNEVGTVAYIGQGPGWDFTNGFNGLAVSMNWLYLYDGDRLEKMNKTTGAIIANMQVASTRVDNGMTYNNLFSGGLAVDVCENIYVGYDSTIMVYNSAFAKTATISVPTTQTYDIQIDSAHKSMYMGGNSVIMSSNLPASPPPVISKQTTPASCSACDGTAKAELTFCGNPDTINATYSWSNGQNTQTATNLCPGIYTVTISIPIGCNIQKFTDTVTIHNGSGSGGSLTVTKTINNVKCFGGTTGSISFNVTGGTTPYTYAWTPAVGTGALASNLGIGTYTCDIKDAGGCDTAAEIITITQPIALAATSSSVPTACGTSAGSATITPSGGTTAYTYLWTTGSQTTPTINAQPAGTYPVTITDANGCILNTSVTIDNLNGPRDSIIATTNIKCYGWDSGSATVGVNRGTTPYTYSWSPSAQTTQTANNLASGTYTVTINDAGGCITSTTVTITQPPALKLTASAFAVTCGGCNGSATVIPSGGTTGYSYMWSNAATAANITGLCAGNYSVVVTDKNGCIHDSTGLVVGAGSSMAITKTITPAVCGKANGSATISVTGGVTPYTYSWSNGSTITSISNVSSGTYCVTVTDFNACTDSACIIMSNSATDTVSICGITNATCFGDNNGSLVCCLKGGTGPFTYSWAPSGGASSTASALAAGIYTISVTDASGCLATATATVTEPAQVVTTPGPPITMCIGQNATITATVVGGTAPYNYTWNTGCTTSSCTVSPVVNTTYTVNVTDINGCTSLPVDAIVNVNPPLSVKASPNKSMCPGASVNLTATGSGGDGTYTYTWAPAASLSCTACQNTVASPATATTYTVTINDACGTPVATASVVVTINPLPVVNFSPDTSVSGCSPLCIDFTDLSTVTLGGIKSWAWTFGDGSTSNQQKPSHCYTAGGIYSVGLTVTSDSGCSSSLTIPNMVTVYNHPQAAFIASPQPVTIVEPTIQFTDETKDSSKVITWLWEFNDQTDATSSLQNPIHTYIDTGTYCADLIVQDVHGCIDSVNECIVIEPLYTLYIPDAFSPNGDGLNDVFQVKGQYVCGFQMFIFDRWGQQLYYSQDINKGWNGTVNLGQNIVQEDTYIYLVYAIDCVQHKKHEYLGKVTVIK